MSEKEILYKGKPINLFTALLIIENGTDKEATEIIQQVEKIDIVKLRRIRKQLRKLRNPPIKSFRKKGAHQQ
jgi:hypothetical protein